MKINFYTPSCGVSDIFGAATFGFAGAEDESLSTSRLFPVDINGSVICGTYRECLENIPEGNWKACIALLGNAGNENTFIRALSEKVSAPIVGGSAAIHPKTGESGLIYGQGEAAIFLIDDERYDFLVTSENIHYDILSEHSLSFSNPRCIEKIDGQDAYEWYCNQRAKLGLAPNDFEHLTFADKYGINIHMSSNNGKLFSGRDVCEKMYLRYASPETVQKRIQSFYDDKDSIIFGCAGLKQILEEGLKTDGLGLFMFGEVVTCDNHSDFGNLMLSKLSVRKNINN